MYTALVSFLLNISLGTELLGHVAILFPPFEELPDFFKWGSPIFL